MRGAAPSRFPPDLPSPAQDPPRPGLVPADRGEAAAGSVYPGNRAADRVRGYRAAARDSGLRVHRGRCHRRLRDVAQFRRHAGRAAAADGDAAGCPPARCGPPSPGRPLLGVQVEAPPAPRWQPGAFGRVRAVLADPVGWRACAYLLLKLLLSVLSAIIVIYLLAWGLPYLTFPIWWEILHANGVVIHVPGWLTWWKPDPLLVVQSVHSLAVSFALVPAGVAALLYCPWWLRNCNAQDGKLIARLLGPPLGHRVRELEQTRAHAVDDSAARLRRIERDLHDGAQTQMVAVAMKLGLAREKLGEHDQQDRASGPGAGPGADGCGAPKRQGSHHRAARPGPRHPPAGPGPGPRHRADHPGRPQRRAGDGHRTCPCARRRRSRPSPTSARPS